MLFYAFIALGILATGWITLSETRRKARDDAGDDLTELDNAVPPFGVGEGFHARSKYMRKGAR